MTKEDFVKMVTEQIRSYLPEEYENAEIKVDQVEKASTSYLGMLVRLPGKDVVPVVNLDICWDIYNSIGDEVFPQIAETITYEPPEAPDLSDYENVRDKLLIRLSDSKGKESFMETVPHRLVEDMLATYHVMFEDMMATINNEMLKKYGISEEQLFADAIANSIVKHPVRTYDLGEMFGKETGTTVLTNKDELFGASVILYPDVLKEIAGCKRVYILPSSVHEVLIYNGDIDPDGLVEIVTSANRTVVDECDKLSDHVYAYENGKISTVI